LAKKEVGTEWLYQQKERDSTEDINAIFWRQVKNKRRVIVFTNRIKRLRMCENIAGKE
jgi:hypothetical protein